MLRRAAVELGAFAVVYREANHSNQSLVWAITQVRSSHNEDLIVKQVRPKSTSGVTNVAMETEVSPFLLEHSLLHR